MRANEGHYSNHVDGQMIEDESIADASGAFVDSGIGMALEAGSQRGPVNFYKQRDSESVQYLPDIMTVNHEEDPMATRDKQSAVNTSGV